MLRRYFFAKFNNTLYFRMKEHRDIENGAERYKLLFDGASESQLLVNLNMTVMDCNISATEVFGLPKEKITGLNIHTLFSYFTSEKYTFGDDDNYQIQPKEITIYKKKYGLHTQILRRNSVIDSLLITFKQLDEIKADYMLLANMASALSAMKTKEEVFDFLAEKLSALLPNTLILLNQSTPDGSELVLTKILGLQGSILLMLTSTLGQHPVGKSFKVTEIFKTQFSKPKLQNFNGSLYEFCNNEIPEPITKLIAKSLDLRSIKTIGIADQGQYFGFIHFLSSGKSDVIDSSFIESLVYLCYSSIARIISLDELKESEKKYKILAENVRDVIFTLDLDLRYTYISPSIKKLRGYEPGELIGESIFRALTRSSLEEVVKKFSDELAKVRQGNDDMIRDHLIEVEVIHKDGHQFWAEIKVTFILDKNNKPLGILGVTRDINERKLAEKELVKKNLELNEAIAQKDKFFSIVAHDLKNPFGHILNFSTLLIDYYDRYPEKKRRQFIELINKSSQQIYHLLENLLDWSRSQGGMLDFLPHKVNMSKIVSDVFELLSNSANAKKINLKKNIPEKLNLKADEYMLKTVLRNLIGNAIKFTNDGGNVTVTAAVENKDVIVSIIDDGLGMDAETLNSLFSQNSSYSKAGTKGERGTGLGLILCKEFIETHGGQLWVESMEGKGSSFSFSIPVSQK